MKNNFEDKVKIYFDSKENIIRGYFLGDSNEQIAKFQSSLLKNFYEKFDQKERLVLIDLTKAGKADSKARRVYAEALRDTKVIKYAFLVKNRILKMTVSFIFSVAEVPNVKIFENEREAINWLKKK